LIRQNKIVIWDDTHLQPGSKWKEEIQAALARAKVAILLVSPHFLDSDFIAGHELPPLLKAAAERGLVIFQIHISPSLYSETELMQYQAANDPSSPLDSLTSPEQNRVLVTICQKLKIAATT